jgi:formate/nitrite transporter FocA (FNT family)
LSGWERGMSSTVVPESTEIAGEVHERTSPSSKIVYAAVMREGDEELERPGAALIWSAIAAGLSMGLSPITEGILRAYLPDAGWRPLIVSFGYSLGFLVIILGRQQLFTENTLTAILPLARNKDLRTLGKVAKLWTLVMAGNLAGAAGIGFYAIRSGAFPQHMKDSMISVYKEIGGHGFGETVLGGIVAGWMIALIVWLLPFAESARVWVIVAITYVVGLAKLPHVVAGSVETFMLGAAGQPGWSFLLTGYILPAFIGNAIGGVTFVALLNHAQVVAGSSEESQA